MSKKAIERSAQGMVGRVIARRYRLDAVLGIGGTGVVYRATTLEDESVVAVKTIRKDLAHERAIARFFRGARLASELDHPGVVPTLAYGQAKGPNTMPFQVMALVDGPSWEDLAPEKLEVSQRLWLICQVLDALAYVHARGVLHRDIKPANILLERQADDTLRPLIMDFGISAAFRADEGPGRITGAHALIGTPNFMAPEQVQPGAMNGPELDLYAVGVMLYLMLSGRLPFQGSPMEVLAAKATVEPPPLDVEGLDPVISRAVGRLIAREPHHRYALAAQARRVLEVHASPVVVTRSQLEQMLTQESKARSARTPAMHWSPPGAGTVEQAWPTLVLANPGSRKVEKLGGRKGVLQVVEEVARQAERGDVRVVSILGESGIGKTAVLERVTANLVEEGRFLVLRAPYFEGGAQAGGVRRGIERMLGVYGLDRQQVRQAVEALLARYDDVSPDELDQLVECLRPPEDLSAEALTARLGEQMVVIARLFRRLSQTRPLLVLIDDADRASTDLARFMEFMLLEARFDRWPMLILCSVDTSREDNPFWRAVTQTDALQGAKHEQVVLPPIPDDALVLELIGSHGLTQAEAHRVVERAGGNPLHASYLADFVNAEKGVMNSYEDVTLNTGVHGLPSELLGLMELRLDRQLEAVTESDDVRMVLESLAVLGQAAPEDLVQAMLPDPVRTHFERSLAALLTMGVVEMLDHAEPAVLSFTPALLRDAVLSRIPWDRMAVCHRRAVGVRMALEAPRRRAHWGAVGDHHAALGEMPEATRSWLKGMYYEVSAGNVVRGVAWGKRAIDHMDPGDPIWAYTTLLVGAMSFDAGESETAEALMRAVLESGDVDSRLQAGDLLCDLLENRGDTETWRKVIQEMNASEEEAGPKGRCALYCARSMWLNSIGQQMEGLADAQRALDLAEPGPPAQRAAQRLAFAYLPLMQLDAAFKAATRSVREAEDIPLLRARSLRILGLVQVWQGKAGAVETLAAVANLCRSAGLLTRFPIALHDQGDAYRLTGEIAMAREKYEETIQLCEGLPLTSTLVLCHFKLAMCDIMDGRPQAMLPGLDALIKQGMDVGLGRSAPFGALLRAWAQARRGDLALAVDAYEQVGPLESILVDPQVPTIILEMCERLVDCVLSSHGRLEHVAAISRLCAEARDLYGGAGDKVRLQQVEILLRRMPSVPMSSF